MERTIKLILEYDGSNFAGWQVQPDTRTVQGTVEDAIEKVLQHPARLMGAGRTDAGVHAAGQVAGFKTTSDIDAVKLKRALNGVLPRDVTVIGLEQVRDGFSARYDARSRTYRYSMSDRRLSIGRSYAWHIPYALNRNLFEEATVCLAGECDLRGFSKGNDEDDFLTIIMNNRWMFHDNVIIFEITGIRFFHHAVRCIVGSAVEVARGKEPLGLIKRILETRDRKLAGPTAPAQGLSLFSIDYGE